MKISILSIKEHIKQALLKTDFYRKLIAFMKKHPKKSAMMMFSVIFLWTVISILQVFYKIKNYQPEENFAEKITIQIDSVQHKRSLYSPGIDFADILELHDYQKAVEEMLRDTSKLDTMKLLELK